MKLVINSYINQMQGTTIQNTLSILSMRMCVFSGVRRGVCALWSSGLWDRVILIMKMEAVCSAETVLPD